MAVLVLVLVLAAATFFMVFLPAAALPSLVLLRVVVTLGTMRP